MLWGASLCGFSVVCSSSIVGLFVVTCGLSVLAPAAGASWCKMFRPSRRDTRGSLKALERFEERKRPVRWVWRSSICCVLRVGGAQEMGEGVGKGRTHDALQVDTR